MYNGFLLKVGDSIIPNKYISRGTYKADAEKRIAHQYTDANGDEHYEVMEHRRLMVSLSISDCTSDIYDGIISLIRDAYVNDKEEKVLVTAYVPKLNRYVEQYCMFEDESPTVFDAKSGRLIYQGIAISFNGYGGVV